jgi:hypothetical protein
VFFFRQDGILGLFHLGLQVSGNHWVEFAQVETGRFFQSEGVNLSLEFVLLGQVGEYASLDRR